MVSHKLCRETVEKTNLVGINPPTDRERHGIIILVDNLARQLANNHRVDVMTGRHFLCEDAQALTIASRTIHIMMSWICATALWQFERGKASIYGMVNERLCGY